MNAQMSLGIIKAAHTVIWIFFVACIFGAPWAAWRGNFMLAAVLIGCVAVEVGVLVANRWSCPLTGLAARYTERREDNFDIYLPRWLARHNKSIFTPLYVLGTAYVAYAWWHRG